jgi:hypothetical protein
LICRHPSNSTGEASSRPPPVRDQTERKASVLRSSLELMVHSNACRCLKTHSQATAIPKRESSRGGSTKYDFSDPLANSMTTIPSSLAATQLSPTDRWAYFEELTGMDSPLISEWACLLHASYMPFGIARTRETWRLQRKSPPSEYSKGSRGMNSAEQSQRERPLTRRLSTNLHISNT